MADILNQGPAFWLPPDFLTDEDDDFLIPHNLPAAAAATAGGDHYSSFPKKVPSFNYPSSSSSPHQMDKDHLFLAAAFTSTLQHNTHFPCCPSKKQQLISPPRPPGVIGTPSSSGRIFKTPNGFLFPHPSPLLPPPPPSALKNPPQAAALYNGPLKQSISLTQQKFMLQNRQGNRVIGGYGGSDQKKKTMASPHSSAWPPLSQQRLNPPPPFLNGSHQVKRKCAGTGVFLPRNPLSDFQKKPDLATQVPVRKNPLLFQSHFIQNLDAAAMAARNRKVQLMNQQQRLSFGTEGGGNNELCLPQEWAY